MFIYVNYNENLLRRNRIDRYLIISLFSLLVVGLAIAGVDDWDIRFGLYSSDSLFTDDWNFAGVDSGANDDWDYRDIQKFYPPTSEYAILFFPHSDPAEPDYWPWPHNYDYASDIRAPLDSSKTWRMKIRSLYSSSKTLTIWWSEMEDLPGTYLPIIVRESGDTINMREQFSYTAVFPPGVKRWKFTVVPDFYNRMSVHPDEVIVRVSETRHFRAYLHYYGDSILANNAAWEYRGSGGDVDVNGYFTGTSPGGGFVIADIGGVMDSAEVTVIPGGDFFEIPLEYGWNLVSLPAIPASNRIDDLFPDIIPPVYWWDSDSQRHRSTDTLTAGKGYFVLSPNETENEFAGTEIDTIVIALHRGWNMVGGPGDIINYPSDFTTHPPGIIMIPPFIFDENEYFIADSVTGSQGFWILSATDGELIITTH